MEFFTQWLCVSQEDLYAHLRCNAFALNWHVSAGPIETEIWGDIVENSEGIGNTKSPFNTFLERAHALTQTDSKKPGWFLPAAAVGEKVWKVATCVSTLL